jgi:urease accessory protein
VPVASRIVAVVVLAVLAPAAHAHDALPGAHTFLAGLLHPLTAFEHVLPLLALGMLAGQRGLDRGQGLLVAFPLAFACGALATTLLALPPAPDAINAGTALIVGVFVALAFALPRLWMYAIVALVGAIHGLGNGVAMDGSFVPFLLGGTLCATLLFGYAFALTHQVLKRATTWRPIAVRALGSWIAAFGVLTLALASLPAAA